MNIEENPYVKPTDYFKEFNESAERLKNDPKAVELDKLCYEALELSPSGKTLMKVIEERFLLPSLTNVGTPTFQVDVIWAEGFKEAFRLLKKCVIAHAQRIKSENKPV